MYRDEKLHIIGSDNTEYTYTIYTDITDIGNYPLNVPVECQMSDGTTGYVRGVPSILHSEPGTFVGHYMELPSSMVPGSSILNPLDPFSSLNPITHSYSLWLDPSEPVNPLTINWHWTTSSGKYSASKYINPDSATLKYPLTIDIEIVAFWNWTDGSQSTSVVGTIPAGATSIEMSGSYGGPVWQYGGGGTVVTTFGFKVRTIVTYRSISGNCEWSGTLPGAGCMVNLSESLPVGRIEYYVVLTCIGLPPENKWGPGNVITAGMKAGTANTITLIPTGVLIKLDCELRYYPETEGAYAVEKHASITVPVGVSGPTFFDKKDFTLRVPTGPSTVISEFYASGTSYTINMPDEYWK